MSDRDELMLDSMGSTPSGFEIKMHAGGPDTARTLLFIADAMRSTLDEHDAPNYVEMEVKASDGKQYIMILQRKGKLTPHSARLAAEEALEASKPRTIESVEELDALPAESVIRSDAGIVYERYADEDGPEFDFWLIPGEQRAQGATKIDLPATVLCEPTP
ncbi:hypothetical protein E5206_09560 [Arthrobacter sp. PAMC25564]|uniref:hypothetical protein n=1 Tax=Arthrobacter sp. PAMC25564 TaxID=2565366 RepID=UPI0010A26CB1|nr:hypothetical protein [Arthrobacter sp. PAMC25564]QCB97149.1 hypothetical protein E5206_09560 [Arthrobacter sp. PAMC25564]